MNRKKSTDGKPSLLSLDVKSIPNIVLPKKVKSLPKHIENAGSASKVKITSAMYRDFKRAFGVFDMDGEGIIDIKDIKCLIRALGMDDRSKKIAHFDRNGNGLLDFGDFMHVVEYLIEETCTDDEITRSFKTLDIEDTGTIDAADLHRVAREVNVAVNDEEVDEMIEATKTPNGLVSMMEFKTLMKQQITYDNCDKS